MRLLALCLVALALAACTPDTLTPTPVPSATPTPSATVTAQPSATPTDTSTPTSTPTAQPVATCPPVATPIDIRVWVGVQCFIDRDFNAEWDIGIDSPLACEIAFDYHGDLPGLPAGTIYSVTTGSDTGRGIIDLPIPGTYDARVQWYDSDSPLIAPWGKNPMYYYGTRGVDTWLEFSFDDYRPTPARHTPTATPPLVRTPTVTPTANLTPHGCALANCVPKDTGCGAKPVDAAGQCSPGYVCCAP